MLTAELQRALSGASERIMGRLEELENIDDDAENGESRSFAAGTMRN